MRDRQPVQQAWLLPGAAGASSALAARAIAVSKERVTSAFTAPSTASTRSMWAATTSRADTSARRSIPASVIAS